MSRTKLYVGVAVAGLLVVSAAGAAYKSLPVNLRQCNVSKDYYAEHEKDCDRFEYLSPFSINKHDRGPRGEYGGGYSSYPRMAQVSIVPDHQGVNESSNTNTPYIAMQTTGNVAAGGGVAQGYAIKPFTAADAGTRYVDAPVYAKTYVYPRSYTYARHVHRHVVKTYAR